jgi:hypothetical protein
MQLHLIKKWVRLDGKKEKVRNFKNILWNREKAIFPKTFPEESLLEHFSSYTDTEKVLNKT